MFKKALLFSVLSLSAGAQASTYIEYDEQAKHLLTAVFTNCPEEFAQVMKGANRVGKATYMAPRPAPSSARKEYYTITTLGGGYAPGFEVYEVATLKITRTSIEDGLHLPDRPTEWKVSCEVETH